MTARRCLARWPASTGQGRQCVLRADHIDRHDDGEGCLWGHPLRPLSEHPLRLDIGGGTAPMPRYVNVDPVHGDEGWRLAMPARLPVDDATVDAIRCSHVMEHIPAGAPRIDTLNEYWRALRPRGTLTIIVPVIGTWHAIADPTHVSFWVPESFQYFTGESAAHADYGILPWQQLDLEIKDGWEAHWFAKPVKEDTNG